MTSHQAVLDFWLGNAALSPEHATEQKKLWYRSSKAIDVEIEEKFSDLHAKAAGGELDHWIQQPETCLALVLVLDQFSRHLYRGTAQAFAFDDQALDVARACPIPESLPAIGHVFLLHPFEHSERIEAQKESLKRFQDLVEQVDREWQPMMRDFQTHAIEHHDIVAKFGRFPHRNDILGRTGSAAEIEFLEQSGKTFGQKPKPAK